MSGDNSVKIQLANRTIGPGRPVYIIAELSANHHQKLDRAVELVHAAKKAGANAIKLQTYRADTLTIDSDQQWFQIKDTIWHGRNLYQLYEEASTPWQWHGELQQLATELGLDFFSTPFDHSAVDFLEEMQVPLHKVASFELVDHGLLAKIASTGKPVIMSTGMASLGEIDEAVQVLRQHGTSELALLKCTSAYPAPYGEMNLRTIPHLSQAFGVVSGLSDHSLGLAVPVTAVALGASIIEKHLCLSRQQAGPDSAFSLEPEEFSSMVSAIRQAEEAMGQVSYQISGKEEASRLFRRSLFVVADVQKGELFSPDNVRSIRPGHGLPPKYLAVVLGRRASCDIRRGTPLSWQLLGGGEG